MLHPPPQLVLQAGSRATFMSAAYQQIWTAAEGGGRTGGRRGDTGRGGPRGAEAVAHFLCGVCSALLMERDGNSCLKVRKREFR